MNYRSDYQVLTVLATFTFLYSLVASRLARSPFSGALVYVSAGLLLGPMGLKAIDFDVNAESFSLVVELTLAVVLFIDAANANLKVLRSFKVIPVRLLLIALPLIIAMGFRVGTLLFPELGLFELALLATMLAPTDAALGKAVVTNKSVPPPVRESLNVESGLNDGICVPLLLLFLALASGQVSGSDAVGLAVLLPF